MSASVPGLLCGNVSINDGDDLFMPNHRKKEYVERSFSFSATSTKLLISLVTVCEFR